MTKTTMTHERRKGILEWMFAQYDAKHLPALQKAANKAMAAATLAIRKKYPERDMAVMRKYNATHKDNCLKFMNTDTQQVFGVDFDVSRRQNYTEVEIGDLNLEMLADLPGSRGCTNGDVFPVSANQQEAIESFVRAADQFRAARAAKFSEYGAFTLACKTVNEFNETIPLPEDMATRFMSGGALIHLSEEKIAELKKEFAPKKAA